jgi:hypothetical protein
MIDAYIVRDPQGRVIGISATSYRNALHDAYMHPEIVRARSGRAPGSIGVPYDPLDPMFSKNGNADFMGYTLKKEQVAL